MSHPAPEPMIPAAAMHSIVHLLHDGPHEPSLEEQEAAEFHRLWRNHVRSVQRESKLIKAVQDGMLYQVYDRQEGRFVYEIDPDWVAHHNGQVQFEHLLHVAIGDDEDEESSEGDEL